ncbi:hypothetical protein [Aquabacterium sp. NJ1]|uniref:hypothetical protein n=1 Tax=Aquabacterium sp. NJ1 TaxID=1538295 RepID=UPI001269A63A|nr:hypothetical protein [Aquabacterium sp. NJ1]
MKSALYVGIALLALTLPSWGCKYEDIGLGEHVNQEQSVFIGRAESASNGRSGSGQQVPAMMRVHQVIKGSMHVGELVPVYTSNSSCGLAIQKGQQWLILASGDPMKSDQPSGSLLLQDQSTRDLVSKALGIRF